MIGGRKFRTVAARKRERARVVRRTVFFSLGGVMLCVGFVYALHRPELRFQEVFVQGGGTIGTGVVEAAVREVIDDSYLYILPKDSTVFFMSKSIERELLIRLPRLARAEVQRVGVRGIRASVAERVPVALWCGDVVPPIASRFSNTVDEGREEVWGSCYLVDGGSFIFAPAPIYTGNVFSRYYGSLDHAEPVGQNLLAYDEFTRFQTLFQDLAQSDRTLEAVLMVDERDIEIYLKGGVRVLALRSEVPELIVRRVHTLFSTDALSQTRIIEYIDMRFDNKVFVKYADTPQAIPQEAQVTQEDRGTTTEPTLSE